MLGGETGGIVGELGLPKNRMFLRILVIGCSIHFAGLAICDVASLFLLLMYHVYNQSYAAGDSGFAPFCNDIGANDCLSREG
jgi:hypothetical protein